MEKSTLTLIRVIAYCCATVAILGILSLETSAEEPLDAAPPAPPSGRTFQNPFLGSPDADDFEEITEEPPRRPDEREAEVDRDRDPFRDREDPRRRRSTPPPSGNSKRTSKIGSNDDVPDPKVGPKGIEVGGDKDVVSKTENDPINIDEETGFGGSQVITDFNFPDADIMDIAKTLGKLTGKNFVVDNNAKGRISIISNSAITVADAWKAFLTALDMNQLALIPSGKYIRIAKKREARDKQLNVYTKKTPPNSDALITRVFPLKYISADEVAKTFRSFMPGDSRIIPHDQTNTVIVTDTGSNISKLAEMLEFLDVEGHDAGIEVIAVKYASASEIAELIDTLLPGTTTSGRSSSRNRSRRTSRFRRDAFQARRTKEGGVINAIISDERTNSLIVHANAKGAQEVKKLVKTLDKKTPAPIGGGKIHVLYLQFADAEKIAETLNNLSSVGRGKKGSSSPSLGPPGTDELFEGEIKVSADKATNSLVITASPSDYVTLQRVISKLDIPLDEVYVEAVIMELSIGKEFSFSANVMRPISQTAGMGTLPKGEDMLNFFTNPLAQKGLVLPFTSGTPRNFTVGDKTVSVGSLNALVKALQSNAKADVLATPQILTLDNTEATFETVEKIPVPTTTATQGTVQAGITKEPISLMIKIKPQINKVSNFVKMEIETKLADVSGREPPAQLQGQAFVTFERNAKTNIVVADSDTVVLGGLVRDKRNKQVSKVPLLGDIPILGWLFSSTVSTMEKTNLLIFITPHIIRNYEKLRKILDAKLKSRDDFIEKNAGGDDPLRSYRDEMIRKLPDIKKIISEQNTESSADFKEEDFDPFLEEGNE